MIIFNIAIITIIWVFHTSLSWWFLTGGWVTTSFFKSPKLLLVYIDITVVSMVSTHPLASKSISPFINPLVTAPISTGIFVCIIIFTQPLRSARIWHKVNFFRRSLTGLHSEFSSSQNSCLTKAEEPSLPDYLPIAGGRLIGFTFPKGISAMRNAISLVQDLNSCRRVHFLWL